MDVQCTLYYASASDMFKNVTDSGTKEMEKTPGVGSFQTISSSKRRRRS